MLLRQQHKRAPAAKQQSRQRDWFKKSAHIVLCFFCLLPALSGCGQEALLPAELSTQPAVTTREPRIDALSNTSSSSPPTCTASTTPVAQTVSSTVEAAAAHLPSLPDELLLLQKAGRSIALEKQSLAQTAAVLTFAGDCTIGSYPECPPQKQFKALFQASGSPTYPFDLVKPWFQADDGTVINFEGTLTTAEQAAVKQWRFQGDPAFAKILPQSGVEVATLANNHSMDYLQAGYDDTLSALTAAGTAVGDTGRPVHFSAKGMDFVILSYDLRPVKQAQRGETEITAHCAEIAEQAATGAAVIVCMHWGVEYEPVAAYQQEYARRMIDAGAELIIGHHPHILQGIECYRGKYICYSLGNFAFGGNDVAKAASLETMLIRAYFERRDGQTQCTGLSAVPCYITSHQDLKVNNYRPQPLSGTQAQKVIDRVLSLSSALPNGIDHLEFYTAIT